LNTNLGRRNFGLIIHGRVIIKFRRKFTLNTTDPGRKTFRNLWSIIRERVIISFGRKRGFTTNLGRRVVIRLWRDWGLIILGRRVLITLNMMGRRVVIRLGRDWRGRMVLITLNKMGRRVFILRTVKQGGRS
jgi:hypothetical protein